MIRRPARPKLGQTRGAPCGCSPQLNLAGGSGKVITGSNGSVTKAHTHSHTRSHTHTHLTDCQAASDASVSAAAETTAAFNPSVMQIHLRAVCVCVCLC